MPLKAFVVVLFFVNLAAFTIFSPRFYSFRPASAFDSHLVSYTIPQPPKINSSVTPACTAVSLALADVNTGTILLSKNLHQKIYPASITKLATALTALNLYPLDEVVSVVAPKIDGKVMNLVSGEKITVKSLVSGLIVYSANDAAFELANHHPAGISGFIAAMNTLAESYGLNSTHFVNYDGIYDQNHYSTAADLVSLARLSTQNPIIRANAMLTKLDVSDVTGQIIHSLVTTNELLGELSQIEGLKTGWTPETDGSFIGLINLDGHYLISVVAQSKDRFTDTRLLVNWAQNNLTWQ